MEEMDSTEPPVIQTTLSVQLRLAHEKNEMLSIASEIIQYDERIAVIKTVCNTSKGAFEALGCACADNEYFSDIIELAELKGLSRALKYAGYEMDLKEPEGETTAKGSQEDNEKRLTAKQYKYILKLMGERGTNKSEIDDYCIKNFGASLQYISRINASSLIESLTE